MSLLTRAVKNPVGAWDQFKKGLILPITSRYPLGTNIFELDWDLLVVFDTLRVDALQEVASENNYDFLREEEIDSITSVGGATYEWISNTFTEEHIDKINDTTYVSANVWSQRVLEEGARPDDRLDIPHLPTQYNTVSASSLENHIPAWEYETENWEVGDNFKHTKAEIVSDLAIEAGRSRPSGRTIAHFIQPHTPYSTRARREGDKNLSDMEADPLNYLKKTGDREIVWQAYLEEVKEGLDTLSTLLENYDADSVLITADHGEAFGEWNDYGHNDGKINPKVRKVPLAWTTATDNGTREPQVNQSGSATVEEHLKALGYRE